MERKIAKHQSVNILCDNWKDIAADFNLSPRQIKRLENKLATKYDKTSRRVIVKHLLHEWRSAMSTEATLDELFRILEKNGLLDMASKYNCT